MRLFQAVLMFFMLGVSQPGCPGFTQTVKSIGKDCAVPAVQKLTMQVLPQVVSSLLSNDWSSLLGNLVSTLKTQGVVDGLTLVNCAVLHAQGNAPAMMTEPNAENVNAIKVHAATWLRNQAVTR